MSRLSPCFAAVLLGVGLLACASPAAPAGASPFDRLAASLAETAGTTGTVNIAVGSFLYEDTELMSPFSALLRDELKIVLPKSGRFKVITRERLADLQLEGRLQASTMIEPGTKVAKVSIEGVQGIVRGRFYYTPPTVRIVAELALLEGGEVTTTKIEIPAENVTAQLWPNQDGPAEGGMADVFQAPNREKSEWNVEDARTHVMKVPHEFRVTLVTSDGNRGYASGDTVGYRLRSDVGCHVAVFCHQADGTTVLLFPNAWNGNTWIPAGKAVDIPGAVKHGFEIVVGPPYGADVVQVVACTRRSALHRLAQSYAAAPAEGTAYRGMTRGQFAQGVADGLADAGEAEEGQGPAQWSEARLVVCTYEKPGKAGLSGAGGRRPARVQFDGPNQPVPDLASPRKPVPPASDRPAKDVTPPPPSEPIPTPDFTGEHTLSYPNGQVSSIISYRNGKRHGLARFFNERGAKTREETYENGVLHGPAREYWQVKGRVSAERTYRSGRQDGEERFYNTEGNLMRTVRYADGLQNGPTTHYTNGRPAEGAYTYVYTDAADNNTTNIARVLQVRQGLANGEERGFYRNGALRYTVSNTEGYWEGEYREWRDNGALLKVVPYRKGLIDGTVTQFKDDGKTVAATALYRDGVEQGR